MNIIMVSHEFFLDGADHHGGIATYTKNMARILRDNGNTVTVVVLSDRFDDCVEWDGISVERVAVPSWIYRIKKVLGNKLGEYVTGAFLIRRRLDRIVRRHRPDIVHYANFKCVGLFRRKDIPCVIRMSSDNVLWRESHRKHYEQSEAFARLTADDRLELLTLKRADGLFASSRVVAGLTEKRIGKPVRVIETPAVLPDVDAQQLPDLIPPNRKYFLYYGSLSRMKGIHIIADVLQDVLTAAPDCLFVLVGHDYGLRDNDSWCSCRDWLREKAGPCADRVIQLEHMPAQQLYPLIRGAYGCVFPSRIDNLPNTCLEAMALGKCVIGTRGASFEQLIEHGKNGLLVRIDDPDSLREGMLTMLEMSDAQRDAMGREARKRMPTPDAVYAQVISFYREVIENHDAKTGA